MKNLSDVLREKEAELQNIQHQIDALKLAIRLCEGPEDRERSESRPADPAQPFKPSRPLSPTADVPVKQFP